MIETFFFFNYYFFMFFFREAHTVGCFSGELWKAFRKLQVKSNSVSFVVYVLKNMLMAAKTCLHYSGLHNDLIGSLIKWRENLSRETHVVTRDTCDNTREF